MSLFAWIQGQLPLLWLISLILLLALLGWLISLELRFGKMRRRYVRLMQGGDGASLEQTLDRYLAQAQATAGRVEQLGEMSQHLERATRYSLQHIGVMRYDAFGDVGGKQSFAVALVDDNGDGVVISSLAARQATRVYAKPLEHWVTAYTLTDEEKQAIAQAQQPRM